MRTLLLSSLLSLFATLAPALGAPPAPPADWDAWAKWAESVYPITDEDGHGPDIGSDEWAQALDRRLGITDAEGHGPDLRSDEWRAAAEKKIAALAPATPPADSPPAEARDLLSTHQTEARFDGIRDHRCRGRTSLCPDDCGHSGKLATFTIQKYVHYDKPGEYGDPKQETFQVLIEDNHNNPKIPADILEAILELEPGAAVRLDWDHEYVTREGASFPERPLRVVRPLAAP